MADPTNEQTYGLGNEIPHPTRFPDTGVSTRVLAIGNGRRVPEDISQEDLTSEDWQYCRNYSDY